MNDEAVAFGQILKILRVERLAASQRAVSARLGQTATTVSEAERGLRPPLPDMVPNWAGALDVTAGSLVRCWHACAGLEVTLDPATGEVDDLAPARQRRLAEVLGDELIAMLEHPAKRWKYDVRPWTEEDFDPGEYGDPGDLSPSEESQADAAWEESLRRHYHVTLTGVGPDFDMVSYRIVLPIAFSSSMVAPAVSGASDLVELVQMLNSSEQDWVRGYITRLLEERTPTQ